MARVIKAITFILLPFIGVFALESILRKSVVSAGSWIINNPKMFLAAVLLYLLVQLLLLALLNNVYLSVIVSLATWLLIAVISFYKQQMMGDPLLPWDFMYANQIFDLIPALYKNVNLVALIGGLLVFIVAIVLLVKYTKFNAIKWPYRIGIFVLCLIPFLLIYDNTNNIIGKISAATGAQNIPWNQTETQQKNGLMLGFMVNIPNIKIEEPANYSKETVDKYVNEIQDIVQGDSYKTSDVNPNVVMIMSEAFWELSNVNITDENGESLNPTVDANKKGHIISPSYGGGTSNVEFEAITGFSMANLLGGSIPYQQYMGRDLPSLASTFKGYGYNTTALHTYHKYFWNRIQAYDSLGFDEFIGLDDLKDPAYYGSLYVDDKVVNNMIMDTIKSSKNPSFIYAVTMQNHGLYNDQRYGDKGLNVVDSYSGESNQILNNLATGFKHSDEMLQELFDELEKLDEPTLVVFYGDHLPSMSGTLEEIGYVKSMASKTLEEDLKTRETPLVVWNNYEKEIGEVGSVSTSFLPPKVMEWAELERPDFYNLLQQFSQELPGFTSYVKVNGAGELLPGTPDESKELVDMYRMIQYDMMFGSRYALDSLYKIQ